jgi:hypothetical protein
MSRLAVVVPLVLGLLSNAAFAQGAAKECFAKPEQQAEQIIREGIRLREGASGCDQPPFFMETWPLWQQIDRQFGARFAQQTAVRQRALKREFPDDPDNDETAWNGRVVMYFRHYPLSTVYCQAIKQQLQSVQKKGWAAIAKLAKAGTDEVEMDYRPCTR